MTSTRHAKFKRALLREVCERLRRDPALIANGRRYIERFMASDPRMAEYYALWREVIELPVDKICDRLCAETPEGEALRDSCPVFTVLPQELRMRLARETERVRAFGLAPTLMPSFPLPLAGEG